MHDIFILTGLTIAFCMITVVVLVFITNIYRDTQQMCFTLLQHITRAEALER